MISALESTYASSTELDLVCDGNFLVYSIKSMSQLCVSIHAKVHFSYLSKFSYVRIENIGTKNCINFGKILSSGILC
jgi:hypothetical protein